MGLIRLLGPFQFCFTVFVCFPSIGFCGFDRVPCPFSFALVWIFCLFPVLFLLWFLVFYGSCILVALLPAALRGLGFLVHFFYIGVGVD
jgi:hypothetical protein